MLWARDPGLAAAVQSRRCNATYLPELRLPEALEVTADLASAVADATLIVMAVPSHGFRAAVVDLVPKLVEGTPILSLTKGIEQGSHLRMTEILAGVIPASPCGVLTGPNLAPEVAAGQPSAGVVAFGHPALARWVQGLLMSHSFRIYTNDDVTGCEIAGAIKNVLAVAAGISDGLGFGDNTRAALITRGLAEMSRLGVELGGDGRTFAGLAGIGDLVATCTSHRSRNRTVGEALGRGRTLAAVVAEMRMVAEGVKTARPMVELAAAHGVEMPIAEQVADMLDGTRRPADAISALMLRPAAAEFPSVDP
jgi:glycerol-3-phosphate dehydrogenase (NAD(P)+)